MNTDQSIAVEYRREGDDKHFLTMDSSALPDLEIDYTGIPDDQRSGTAARLLCASSLYCFAATLGSALKSRGAKIKSLTGRAIAEKGRDFHARTKITMITIQIKVEVEEKDQPILEKCRLLMQNGCLVTYSIDEGIHIEYEIQ
ncbi:MAG: OsmC family peroxiredoxin [Chloroflexi bacterium]|nr:OsmC family peroxiredoxin [Chloroflexota bacterium]